MSWDHFLGMTTLLYGLSNPVGVIPIYLQLLHRASGDVSHRILLIASTAVAALLVVAALFGWQILTLFNVEIDDFRIAGGILALRISIDMFHAHGGFLPSLEERAEAEADFEAIAITPLAFPLLVGPAEISVIITLSSDMPHLSDKVPIVFSAILTIALTALTLWLAKPLQHLLGRSGINLTTRVMALIVASVGVNFILTGIKDQLPALAH